MTATYIGSDTVTGCSYTALPDSTNNTRPLKIPARPRDERDMIVCPSSLDVRHLDRRANWTMAVTFSGKWHGFFSAMSGLPQMMGTRLPEYGR